MSDSLWPHGLKPARLFCPWNSPGKNTVVGKPFPSLGDLPNPDIEPRSPMLKADSSSSEPPGRPNNTGVGSLSLLQGIFPTHELNQGLLHCRQILYQLSYQGNPYLYIYMYVYMNTYIYSFSDSFPYSLLHDIQYSSLCYIVGLCWLSSSFIVVCILVHSRLLVHPSLLLCLVTIALFPRSVSLFFFCK